MTVELHCNPQPLSTIPLSYRTLLGEYIRNRKEIEGKRKEEDKKLTLMSLLREARRGVSNAIPQEDRVEYLAATLDLFGNDVIFKGGIAVLEALFSLDAGTIAALIEWNRLNLVRIEQKRVLRRSAAFLIAGLSVVATLWKLIEFGKPFAKAPIYHAIMDVVKLDVQVLLHQWWLYLLFFGFLLVLEVALWMPGKLRVEEFGQMLAVAFAYVSKMPNIEKDKTSEAPQVSA